MEVYGEQGQGDYSFPASPVAGLSMLDITAANHDWQTLRAIIALHNNTVDVSQTDEEGYTPFHRLEYNWVGRTFSNTRLWYPAFSGSSANRQSSIRQTIEALQAMGGQIDILTKCLDYTKFPRDNRGGFTPLMLAVRKGDLDAVVALLQCGADPNIRNDQGLTALAQLPQSLDPVVKPERLPLIAQVLLDNGARPVHDFLSRETPLAAAAYSSLDVVDILLGAGAQPTEHILGLNVIAVLVRQHRILDVMSRNDRAHSIFFEYQIKSIIQKHVLSSFPVTHPGMLEQVDEEGGTLLHYVAYAGFPSVVDVLLKCGVKPNVFREDADQSKMNRKHRLKANTKYKTPRDKMLYNNYLWCYNSSARSMTFGTPLDCALYMRLKIERNMEIKEWDISIADLSHMLKMYHQIEKLLQSYGGTYMTPLTG
ncbi:MAG: hypothetical protein Q9187_005829 [Circinaria calcarea]